MFQSVHIKHAMVHNGTYVHQNLPKNYLKIGNNYGIGFRVRIGVRYRVMVSI